MQAHLVQQLARLQVPKHDGGGEAHVGHLPRGQEAAAAGDGQAGHLQGGKRGFARVPRTAGKLTDKYYKFGLFNN